MTICFDLFFRCWYCHIVSLIFTLTGYYGARDVQQRFITMLQVFVSSTRKAKI